MAEKLTMGADGKLNVPNNPIIPFIEGDGIGPLFPNPITVNFTEYGNIGQYIAGSFSGTIKSTPSNIIKTVTCSFRVKRRF